MKIELLEPTGASKKQKLEDCDRQIRLLNVQLDDLKQKRRQILFKAPPPPPPSEPVRPKFKCLLSDNDEELWNRGAQWDIVQLVRQKRRLIIEGQRDNPNPLGNRRGLKRMVEERNSVRFSLIEPTIERMMSQIHLVISFEKAQPTVEFRHKKPSEKGVACWCKGKWCKGKDDTDWGASLHFTADVCGMLFRILIATPLEEREEQEETDEVPFDHWVTVGRYNGPLQVSENMCDDLQAVIKSRIESVVSGFGIRNKNQGEPIYKLIAPIPYSEKIKDQVRKMLSQLDVIIIKRSYSPTPVTEGTIHTPKGEGECWCKGEWCTKHPPMIKSRSEMVKILADIIKATNPNPPSGLFLNI